MKKLISLFVFVILLTTSHKSDARVYYTFEKSGGSFVFNWFNSYIGFAEVIPNEELKKDGTTVKHVTCKGEGRNRCEFTSTSQTTMSVGCTFNSDILDENVRDIVRDIENVIIEEGRTEIIVSRKINAISIEGESCYLSFEALWIGDEKGNGKIIVSIDKITI